MKHQIDTLLMTAEKVSFTFPKKGFLTNMKDSLFFVFLLPELLPSSFHKICWTFCVSVFYQPFILYVCKIYHSLIIFPCID